MIAREMTAEDRRYVVPTWAQSSRYAGLSLRRRFSLVDAVLDSRPRVVVLARERTVHAWACGDEDALHFVYIPIHLRGFGLAKRVLTELLGGYPERINVTHPWPRESSRFRYTPHLIVREPHEPAQSVA